MHVWRWLTATKQSGQAHSIDSELSHQRKGNLIVYCPACCEQGFNMEPQWETTPLHLRYVR